MVGRQGPRARGSELLAAAENEWMGGRLTGGNSPVVKRGDRGSGLVVMGSNVPTRVMAMATRDRQA